MSRGVVSSLLLGFWGASRHNSNGRGSSLEDFDEDITFFSAGADVWPVFISVFLDLSLKFELHGEVPNGSEELPHVSTT